MKKLLYIVGIIVGLVVCNGAFAAGEKTTTSKGYVDAQMATKQAEIPAVNTNTVLSTTNTAGEIGEKSIYDTTQSYAT